MERALERAVEARGPADVAVLPRPELREQIVGVSIVEEKALPEPGPGSPLGRTGLALWGIHLAAVFLVGGRGYGTGGGVRVSGDAQNRADLQHDDCEQHRIPPLDASGDSGTDSLTAPPRAWPTSRSPLTAKTAPTYNETMPSSTRSSLGVRVGAVGSALTRTVRGDEYIARSRLCGQLACVTSRARRDSSAVGRPGTGQLSGVAVVRVNASTCSRAFSGSLTHVR